MRNSAAGKVLGLTLLLRLFLAGVVFGLPADSLLQKTVALRLPKLTSQFSFIKYSKNQLFQPDSLALNSFFDALDSLQEGTRQKVNVVHLGDSHIQADIFSGRMRSLLQDSGAFNNGGRGFVFPYTLAKTNNPWNYKIAATGVWSGCRNVQSLQNCNWGLAGITAETSDSSASFLVQTPTVPIQKVRIFYPVKDLTQFNISLKAADSLYLPARIDSLGFAEFLLPAEVNEVRLLLTKSFLRQQHFTLQGVSLDNNRSGLVYSSIGVNGAEVVSFLKCQQALENNLKALSPDLIIISLGTNDAYGKNFDENIFKQNYGKLLERIKQAAPNASIILTGPGDNYRSRKYPNYSNAKATAKLKELAKESGSAVWDFYQIMGGFRSVVKWQLNGLAAKDRVHLTGKGYRLQGDLLFEALMQEYQLSNRKTVL